MTIDEIYEKWKALLKPKCRFKKSYGSSKSYIRVGRQTGKSIFTKYIIDKHEEL